MLFSRPSLIHLRPSGEAPRFAQKAYPNETVSVQNEAAEPPLLGPQTSLAAEDTTGNRKSDFLKN
jgi:hypothetical protein